MNHLIEAGLSGLFLAGAAFVFWVIFHEGRRFHFRPVGLLLVSCMTLLAPIVVADGTLALLQIPPPRFVRWLSPAESLVDCIALLILTFKPELVGYRIHQERREGP